MCEDRIFDFASRLFNVAFAKRSFVLFGRKDFVAALHGVIEVVPVSVERKLYLAPPAHAGRHSTPLNLRLDKLLGGDVVLRNASAVELLFDPRRISPQHDGLVHGILHEDPVERSVIDDRDDSVSDVGRQSYDGDDYKKFYIRVAALSPAAASPGA